MIKEFIFEGYRIFYPSSLEYNIFNNEWHYGITFIINNSRYEFIHNKVGLTRILLNLSCGHFYDLPVNLSTITNEKFIPDSIKIEKI